MKIRKIDAVCQDIPLSRPFAFASGTLDYLPYAWVRVETEDGSVGYGECPTYWDPSGETQLAAVGAIQHITPMLVGVDAFDMERIFELFDRVAYGAFAAKCGLDMALFDIVGKHLGVPAHILLGGSSYAVNVNAVIPLNTSKQHLEELVSAYLEDGHKVFKVKVGTNTDKELDLVRCLSGLLSDGCIIFIDANQAWRDPKTAIRAIHQFEDAGAQWVEQPTLAQDVDGLREVKMAVKLSVIADESVYSPIDAMRLTRAQAADLFNVKLAKCGGMYLGKKLFAVAQAGNIRCMLGSMIESSLGMLANYHFARAHPMVTCGLSAYSYIANPVDVGIAFRNGQMMLEKELPGLGYSDPTPFEQAFT
ncbi:hypothetical protein GC175_01785 [bacterium]|nr:hypothetical protein [bacterium]